MQQRGRARGLLPQGQLATVQRTSPQSPRWRSTCGGARATLRPSGRRRLGDPVVATPAGSSASQHGSARGRSRAARAGTRGRPSATARAGRRRREVGDQTGDGASPVRAAVAAARRAAAGPPPAWRRQQHDLAVDASTAPRDRARRGGCVDPTDETVAHRPLQRLTRVARWCPTRTNDASGLGDTREQVVAVVEPDSAATSSWSRAGAGSSVPAVTTWSSPARRAGARRRGRPRLRMVGQPRRAQREEHDGVSDAAARATPSLGSIRCATSPCLSARSLVEAAARADGAARPSASPERRGLARVMTTASPPRVKIESPHPRQVLRGDLAALRDERTMVEVQAARPRSVPEALRERRQLLRAVPAALVHEQAVKIASTGLASPGRAADPPRATPTVLAHRHLFPSSARRWITAPAIAERRGRRRTVGR